MYSNKQKGKLLYKKTESFLKAVICILMMIHQQSYLWIISLFFICWFGHLNV